MGWASYKNTIINFELIRKKISAFAKRVPDAWVILITALYFVLSAVSGSHKIFFALSTIYFVTLVITTSSIQKTILYAFFPLRLLHVGRELMYSVVPSYAIMNPLYWGEDRYLRLEFSPYTVVGVLAIVVLLFEIIRRPQAFRVPAFLLFLLLSYALHLFSAILSPYNQWLSLWLTAQELLPVVWLCLVIITLRSLTPQTRKRVLAVLCLIFASMIIFEAFITVTQTMKRSTLGLSIEKTATIPSFGMGADEDISQFRPIGLSYHANSLANWQVTILPAFILLWLYVRPVVPATEPNSLLITTLASSMITIFLTLSRSAYLGFIVAGIMLLGAYAKRLPGIVQGVFVRFNKIGIFTRLPFFLLMGYLIFIIGERVLLSTNMFSDAGGFSTRKEQTEEALQIIQAYPIFGVGIGMFIPASYSLFPNGVMRWFPEEIHNGFLLYLAERGIVATTVYMLGIIILLKRANDTLRGVSRLIVWIAFIMSYTMMAFQPFVNTLSTGILIGALLVVLNSHETS